jgi:hypothetical protein
MSHLVRSRRRGLTLAELLTATTITTMIVAALGVFTHAVMDGYQQTNQTGDTAQAARVVLSRISHMVATSRQVLTAPPGVSWPSRLNACLIVWERDSEPGDTKRGQPNWNEVVIYAQSRKNDKNLLELRPTVDANEVVPLSDPNSMNSWIRQFCSELNVVTPVVVLLPNTKAIHFEITEKAEPQGIANLVQQDVRIRLCIRPADEKPTAFFGAATRRYVPSSSLNTGATSVEEPTGSGGSTGVDGTGTVITTDP